MGHYFGEKDYEYHAKAGKELPVWRSPKFEEAKRKAEEIIDSKKYNVSDGDFWILMNATKTGKMAYTGLIISHNGCLKINDSLESKFKPSCVTLDKEGYNGSLVYTYINDEQGLYEVGELSPQNCTNAYPYAMAYKRLFDRVTLKLSKLAYAGIYSDAEADEFVQQLDAPAGIVCQRCKASIDAETKAESEKKYNGKCFCIKCQGEYEEHLKKTAEKAAVWKIENPSKQG